MLFITACASSFYLVFNEHHKIVTESWNKSNTMFSFLSLGNAYAGFISDMIFAIWPLFVISFTGVNMQILALSSELGPEKLCTSGLRGFQKEFSLGVGL